MDEAGSHHPQQNITETVNRTLDVLTHKWELNTENIWVKRREQHTPQSTGGRGEGGNVEDGSIGAANHHGKNTPM